MPLFEPLTDAAEPAPARPAWVGVATSALVHLALLTAVLWVERPQKFVLTRAVDSLEQARRERAKAVNFVYLAPPRPRPLPPTVRQGPQPPHKVEPPTPPAPVTPPPVPEMKDKTADPATEKNETARSDPLAFDPAAPAPAPVHRMRSLAFNPGEYASPLTRTDPTPIWHQPPDLGSIGNKCVPGPPHTRRPDEPVTYGIVAGRVYQQGSTAPLAGAVLSVMGTPYQTTSDSNGEYVLRFDADLLSNCQVQNVRVTLDGFISQLLVLSSGGGSSDVNLHRSVQ